MKSGFTAALLTITLTLGCGGVAVAEKVPDFSEWGTIEEVRLLAEKGNAMAQFQMGRLTSQGDISTYDPVSAARWFRLAASNGSAQAQAALGMLYWYGYPGIKNSKEALVKNHKEALRLLELASANDSVNRMFGDYGGNTMKEQYEDVKKRVAEENNVAAQKIKDQEAKVKLVISDKAKNYRVNGDSFIVSGSSSSLKIVSKLDASVIKSIIINRGNCKTKEYYRDVPIRFGTVLNVGYEGCEVVEVKIQTYHGDAVYEMNR